MQEEKQHYLYVLVPENGDTFKIGISCGPLARFKGLQVSPDFALSRVYRGTRLAIVNLERALHATFSPWNAPWEKSAGGGHTGVVCGRGRNPTLRLWPTIFSGKIDVFRGDRRSRLISSMTSVAPA